MDYIRLITKVNRGMTLIQKYLQYDTNKQSQPWNNSKIACVCVCVCKSCFSHMIYLSLGKTFEIEI